MDMVLGLSVNLISSNTEAIPMCIYNKCLLLDDKHQMPRWPFMGIVTFFSTSTFKLNSILTNFSFSTIKYDYSCRHVVQWSLYRGINRKYESFEPRHVISNNVAI